MAVDGATQCRMRTGYDLDEIDGRLAFAGR